MDSKYIFVTILGKPNVGKSSILNKLIGEKIAVISNKPQTTRTKITGVINKDKIQYVFIDTPGYHKPKDKLSEHMMKVVKNSVTDIDLAMFVVDSSKEPGEMEKVLVNNLNSSKIPIILVMNKIDLISKEKLVKQIEIYSALSDFAAVIPVSVLNDDGVNDILLNEVSKFAKSGPHFFSDDTLTDQPEKVIAAEIIREKLLNLLSEEVPHGIAVTIELMREREDKDILDIDATIYCEKESHKGIVIGKGGALLKKVGSLARVDLESFFQIKINLKLWVKVKPDWRNKEGMIKNFGLDSSN